MTTGKNDSESAVFGLDGPFPVRNALGYVCMIMRGLEGILRGVSLMMYKLGMIDRKWMSVLIFLTNLMQFMCGQLSADDKLEDTEQ